MASRHSARFAKYLERSLALLERECPRHWAAVRQLLGDRSIAINVEHATPARIRFDRRPWVTRSSEGRIRVRVGEACLAALLRGDRSLEEAILRGDLDMVGSLDDVVCAIDSLFAWIHGAIRSPALARLRRDYLAGIAFSDDMQSTVSSSFQGDPS